ncbi:MAG: GNAT family N-acetyltransferase [bacterium]
MKKLDFTIRSATKKDKDTLADFRYKLDTSEYRRSHLYGAPSRAEVLRRISSDFKDKNYFIFVAEAEGNLVGFATASRRTGKKKKVADLDAIWVEPKYRKQGIAHALTEVRLRQLSKFKLDKIEAYVRPDNVASQRNIQSFGGRHMYNVYQIKPRKK